MRLTTVELSFVAECIDALKNKDHVYLSHPEYFPTTTINAYLAENDAHFRIQYLDDTYYMYKLLAMIPEPLTYDEKNFINDLSKCFVVSRIGNEATVEDEHRYSVEKLNEHLKLGDYGFTITNRHKSGAGTYYYTLQSVTNENKKDASPVLSRYRDDHNAPRVANEAGGMQSKTNADLTLLPLDALIAAAEVMTVNCAEHGGHYPRDNWKLVTVEDMFTHAIDHAVKLTLTNGEDQLEHAKHLVCRAMMIVHLLDKRLHGDS